LLEIEKQEDMLIQKQMAMEKQVSFDMDSRPSDKKEHEMIIEY